MADKAKFIQELTSRYTPKGEFITLGKAMLDGEVVTEVETVDAFGPNDVLLDIRSIDEQDDKPFKPEGVEVASLPFYKLSTAFGDLDQSKNYLLWCDRGVMSRLQALYLREQGFENVKVYRA